MASSTTFSICEQQHPLIRKLANAIESTWQRYLNLSPYHFRKIWDTWRDD